ncbi:MAG: hypothetical protein ISP90_08310 [Nevskia sp.]|nr:hypothetical protein [Nevskia sp.]
MSKFSAIDAAVRFQLINENRRAPITYQETLGGDYKYTPSTIRKFLHAVSARLLADEPAYDFAWPQLDLVTCLVGTVTMLEEAIAANTTTVVDVYEH